VVQWVFRLASVALAAVMSAGPAMATPISFEHGPILLQVQPAKAGVVLEVADVTVAMVLDAGVMLVEEKTGRILEARTDGSGLVAFG
jgi:hypothetical protein